MFDAKLVEFELTLSDPVHEFDAGDGRRGSSKMLEAEHRTKPQLDRSMVLFNQIVDVFGRPDLALISLGMFAESLCRPAMRRLMAVERDLVWQLAPGVGAPVGRRPWRRRRPAWREAGNRRCFPLCRQRGKDTSNGL